MARRPSTATLSALTIAVALVGNMATNTVSVDEDWWPTATWTAVGVLAAAALAVDLLGHRAGQRTARTPDLSAVADRLAAAVHAQWRDEVTRRSLNDPYPLPIGWEPAAADLVTAWADIVRLADRGTGWRRPHDGTPWASAADDLAEADGKLVTTWRKVPTGRLVVLGEPGAGKTMLLAGFVVDLLAPPSRRPGDPVPVLVSIASWNPRDQHLDAWLVDRLAIDHPALEHEETSGRTLFKALLDNNLIIVVLDGLDEIPEPLRGPALGEINLALHGGRPLVISSRTDAYRAATRPLHGQQVTLTGAAGIRLQPLRTNDVLAYLRSSAGGPAGERRWARVERSARDGGLLADVLRTPLMATLARTVYNPAPRDSAAGPLPHPDQLLTLPDRESVERHLFDGFVPAAFRAHPTRRSRWRPQEAVTWLGYLAHHLEHDRHGQPNLTWWQLRLRSAPLAPPTWFAIAAGAVLAVVAALAAGTLYSAVYSRPVIRELAPIVLVSVVLVHTTVWWVTGRLRAALSAGVVVAISSGLAIDLGGDLLLDHSWASPSLVIGVGLAAGSVHPVKARPPTAARAASATAFAAFALTFPIYHPILGLSDALFSALVESVLTGLLVVVVMTLATNSRDQPWELPAFGPLLHLVGAFVGLAVWSYIRQAPPTDAVWLRTAAEKSVSALVALFVLVLVVRSSGPTPPRPGRGTVLAVLVAVTLAVRHASTGGDLATGVLLCLLPPLFLTALPRRQPQHPHWAPADPRMWLTDPRRAGVAFGFLHGIYYNPTYGLAVGLAAGLAVELVARHLGPGSPARGLRFTGKGLVVAAVVGPAVTALLHTRGIQPASAGLMGAVVGVAVGLVYGMDAPREITPVRSPRQVLVRDRTAFLIGTAGVATAVTVAIGFVAGMGTDFHVPSALVGGLLYGVPTGVLVAASRTQWLHYTATRCALALRGRLPWSLMSFLADAHAVHGVLRRDGATYQFRHLDMQRRLAATCTAQPR
ncbi:NACHT domain-containing protein [Saccharothrix sp. NPDC042600]|uniref:NACHT domain-containing protein n=1 Tax=Saccharothrix TaxID=2071 RepID=UPI003403B6B4|nr:hypothetical protein GCM10017745_50550 [Saccharothrix mutabilis subsp. capreolus]